MKRILRVFLSVILPLALAIQASHAADVSAAAPGAGAGEFVRSVSLEWDPIDDAASYEIEFASSLPSIKPLVFRTKEAAWSGKLRPGTYRLRVRSYDSRGVPGDWGAPSEFIVPMPVVQALRPKGGEEVVLAEGGKGPVTFSWAAQTGATGYQVEVDGKGCKKTAKVEASKTSTEIELPAGVTCAWKVTALGDDGKPGEVSQQENSFRTIGARVPSTDVKAPRDEFVRDLSWSKPDGAATFTYELRRRDKGGKWRSIEKKTITENSLPFPAKYPGGTYRLEVRAEAPNRLPSELASREFRVKDGDRSEAARLWAAMSLPKSYYATGSYFVTMVDYKEKHPETGGKSKFSAVGGTGRLALGRFRGKSSWGWLAAGELSGFNVGSRNFNFISGETNVVYRRYIRITQLRLSSGLFYKSLPDIIRESSGTYSVQNVSFVGPHFGFEFWKPLSSRFGIQVNARGFYQVYGVSTPNGQPIIPGMSYNFGILGSYRLSAKAIGFMGYAYRMESIAYKALSGSDDATSTSLASPGDVNDVTVTGHYLNMILEWSF